MCGWQNLNPSIKKISCLELWLNTVNVWMRKFESFHQTNLIPRLWLNTVNVWMTKLKSFHQANLKSGVVAQHCQCVDDKTQDFFETRGVACLYFSEEFCKIRCAKSKLTCNLVSISRGVIYAKKKP